jgi:hypothetical protein
VYKLHSYASSGFSPLAISINDCMIDDAWYLCGISKFFRLVTLLRRYYYLNARILHEKVMHKKLTDLGLCQRL